jgi:hypothetical protein
MAVLDCSPSALKILYNSNEFMPYVVFMAAPGLDEMRHIYENGKMAGAIMASQRTLNNFEKTSSIRRFVVPSLCSPLGLATPQSVFIPGSLHFPYFESIFPNGKVITFSRILCALTFYPRTFSFSLKVSRRRKQIFRSLN